MNWSVGMMIIGFTKIIIGTWSLTELNTTYYQTKRVSHPSLYLFIS